MGRTKEIARQIQSFKIDKNHEWCNRMTVKDSSIGFFALFIVGEYRMLYSLIFLTAVRLSFNNEV